MIRIATHKDSKIIVDLLKEFLQNTAYAQAKIAIEDTENLCKLTWMILQHGYIWLAFINDEPVGLFAAIKQPTMWTSRVRELRELVWYVKPEHRKNTIGGKLFLKYCKKGELLIKQGEIDFYFTTRMSTTDPYNLERRGFRLVEQTFIKEI